METIKQIAPYLPYDLGIKILNYKSDYVGIEYSTIIGFYYVKNISHFAYFGGSTGKSIGECKFIMRPLSDLTKPCLDDGKIPIVELAKIHDKLMLDDICTVIEEEDCDDKFYMCHYQSDVDPSITCHFVVTEKSNGISIKCLIL